MWRLLSKSEIHRLLPEELNSYARWLRRYQANQQEEFRKKTSLLKAIQKANQDSEERSAKEREDVEIIGIQQFLSSYS